jgi:hypothetical protein
MRRLGQEGGVAPGQPPVERPARPGCGPEFVDADPHPIPGHLHLHH